MGRVDAGSVLFLPHGPAAGDKAPLSNQDPQAVGNAGCWTGSRVKHPPYARFHKCDLQLQTPADGRHWEGSSKLPATATDSEVQSAATDFVDRCYEVGLEVIGITDHNLGGANGPRFMDAVREEIVAQAATRCSRITVFPGFEIRARHVSGVHLLCLFSPKRSTKEVSDILSGLGLPAHDRGIDSMANVTLDELLRRVDAEDGIVIAAHVNARSGALDGKTLSDDWQAQVITNPRLLCMELTKPRGDYRKNMGKLGQIVRNELGAYHRAHPIAVINSSDNKRLRPGDGKGDGNHIGSRHTWIKMSKPSIEGLRQAFLDHDSRIEFGPDRPEDLMTHPRIERITIRGAAFLDDQEIRLSPNLNTLIGGGGTGKSTIIEYVRAAVGRPPETSDDVLRNHQRALSALGGGEVGLFLAQGDERLEIQYPSAHSTGSQVQVRFPVVAFSQREVFAVAESPPATLALIDQLQRDQMDQLARREARAAQNLAELDLQLSRLGPLRMELIRIEAEAAREQAGLRAVEDRQAPLAALNLHRREREAVEAIDANVRQVVVRINDFAGELALNVGRSHFRQPDTPHAADVEGLLTRLQDAVDTAAAEIRDVAVGLSKKQRLEAEAELRDIWAADLAQAESAYDALAAEAGQLQMTDPEPLRRHIVVLVNELAEARRAVAALEERHQLRPVRQRALEEVWAEQLAARREMADQLRSWVADTDAGTPYVEVTIRPFDDLGPLCQKLKEWIDLRSFGEDSIRKLCDHAGQVAEAALRIPTIVRWIEAFDRDEEPPELITLGLSPRNRAVIARDVTEERRRELLRLRLPDVAEVLLRRRDGSDAGTLEEGLSVGQRCTAILALALAAGDEPILIDQPEDEIDNEFIYSELVPLLRAAKKTRQIIVSTHNPNLPVNGDAELIYALEARGKDGKVRGRRLAQGSLDRDDVKEIVERIMEGSREAFQRRQARYGF